MAKLFLGSNETFTVGANSTADVYGVSAGNEKVVVTAGAAVTLDQNVERVELSGAASAYTYAIAGNVVTVKSGTTTVATFVAGNGDKTVAFADGSATLALTGLNVATLGGQAVPTTAGALTNVTLNAADKSASATGSTVSSPTTKLTTGLDNLASTSANTTFAAQIVDNANTLQSGDTLVGSGSDKLVATIGNSQKFAILANTTGISTVQIQAQGNSLDSTNNNTSQTNQVQIDAQNLNGVTRYENNNSRSDLLIEDVRLWSSNTPNTGFAADRQEVVLNADRTVNDIESRKAGITGDIPVTSAVTIAMVSTDPGHVDYAVYFDQNSLRAENPTSNSVLTLQILDIKGANGPAQAPLASNVYKAINLNLDNKDFTFSITDSSSGSAITNGAKATAMSGYVDITKALNADIDKQGLSSKLKATVVEVPSFQKFDADTGAFTPNNLSYQIQLTATNSKFYPIGSTLAKPIVTTTTTPIASWITAGGQPANSNLYANVVTQSETTTLPLVTSNIVLDDVGRGAIGGNFVAGNLATGDTSNSLGIDKFKLHVDRTSRLESISSTNNTLKEVIVDNAANSSNGSGIHNGDLFVTGQVITGDNPSANLSINAPLPAGAGVQQALPGVVTDNGGSQFNAFGFNDVRVIDASAMTGAITFTAGISTAAIDKYLNLVDQASNVANFDNTKFIYTGSKQADNITVSLDPQAIAASKTSILSGREDITLAVNGGEGNDTLNVGVYTATDRYGNYLAAGNMDSWYVNQRLNANITVNGGDGNDTITTPGAGDKTILGGAGSDAIYTDNTGRKVLNVNDNAVTVKGSLATATWVNNAAVKGLVNNLNPAANINNIESDANGSYNLYLGKVVVKFDGYTATAVIPQIQPGSFLTSDLQINQAIKQAINSDLVLNKLLIAQDGPANTLVITSKIDGVYNSGDLSFSVVAPTQNEITSNSIYSPSIIYSGQNPNATPANASAATIASIVADQANAIKAGDLGLWSPSIANDGYSNIVGANSRTTSDNKIDAGASATTGADVVVLGTTIGSDDLASSNEVVTLTPSFGKQVIVHFDTSAAGRDTIDFSGLFGGSIKYNPVASATVYDVIVGSAPVSIADGKYHVYINGTTVSTFTPVSASVSGAIPSVNPVVQGDLTVIGLGGQVNGGSLLSASTLLSSGAFGNNVAVPTPGTQPGVTLTTKLVDGSGTQLVPVNLTSAATGTFNFTDNASVANNVVIPGFGADDYITITGATQAQYNSAFSLNAAGDVAITYNSAGTLNTITLTGVAPGGFVNDVASFNALPVGNIFFA